MKKQSWPVLCALSRLNKGKKSSAQIANERTHQTLKDSIASLQAEWIVRDAAENQTKCVQTEKTDMKNKNESPAVRRTKFTAAVRREQQAQKCDYSTAYNTVMAQNPDLVAEHRGQVPEFDNSKFEGVAERQRKTQELVAAEMKQTGFSYDICFRAVIRRQPELCNTKDETVDLAGAGQRSAQLQELLVAKARALGLDLQTNYRKIWNIVAAENKDLFASMIQPAQTPRPVFKSNAYINLTPPRVSGVSTTK